MNLTGALTGTTIAAGLLLIANGLHPAPVKPPMPKVGKPIRSDIDRKPVTAGTICALMIGAVTGWWALGLLILGASVLLPAMVNERKGQAKDRERLAALASWVEAVRDMLAAASGIEEAIVRSAETLTPDSPIRQPIGRLRGTTEALGLREGLRRFGEDLADPIGDYIAASLLVASERPSGAVHDQLSEAASNARESVAVRERVEASRARMWTASSTIALISIVMVTFVIATQATYAAWYSTVTGQTVLLACGSVELVGMWWMARMARPALGHRVVLFDPPTQTATTAATNLSGGRS